jgi:hypothetical protein
MALGANLKRIVIDVLGARAWRALLFGVEPSDPAVHLSVPSLLLIVTLSACVLPAFRAATANPAAGLRSD